MEFDGAVGVQFVVHTSTEYDVPGIVDLAARAEAAGFDQFWISDTLGYRQVFVAMAAVAQEVSIDVGSAVFAPYYRNPLDVAGALASISELSSGREVSFGIGRGSVAVTGYQVATPRPYRMIEETVACVSDLLAGEEVRFGDYGLVAEYFHMQPDARLQLSFEAPVPVRSYLGGYGRTALRTAGRHLDGSLIGGEYLPLLRTGKVGALYALAEEEAAAAQPDTEFHKLCEINLSIADDPETAREYTKPYTAHKMMTIERTAFDDAEFAGMGIDPRDVARLHEAFEAGATILEATELVTDAMIEALFVVGDPEAVLDQLREVLATPPTLDLDQIIFAKLGPDNERAIDLLADEILPEL